MRLIPSTSPEASVSGQGKQGMTPSGPHQCCSASSSLQAGGGGWFEAGAIQHQGSASTVCGRSCLLPLLLWLQHRCCMAWGTWGWARSKALATACAKAALKAEVGHCHRSHLQMAGFVSMDAVQACSFPKCKLPSQRCPQKGIF